MIKKNLKAIFAVVVTTLLLSSCLDGKNQVSLSGQIGTYIQKEVGIQTMPMIQIDNNHYVYHESFTTLFEEIAPGQRVIISYSVDFNQQPDNLLKIGCYKASTASVALLETSPTGMSNTDEISYNDSITTIGQIWTNYQPDLKRYYLTTSGYVLGEKENKFKLFYKNYVRKTKDYDTIKFELRRDKYLNTAAINQTIFTTSFDLSQYSSNFPTGDDDFIIISIQYPQKGKGLNTLPPFQLFLPKLENQ